MANRYWVGGAGTWDLTSTAHWSATSGGVAGASAPTQGDDVYFDVNSGSGAVDTSDPTFRNPPICRDLHILSGALLTFGAAFPVVVRRNVDINSATGTGTTGGIKVSMAPNTGLAAIDTHGNTIGGLEISPTVNAVVDLNSDITTTGSEGFGNVGARSDSSGVELTFNTNNYAITALSSYFNAFATPGGSVTLNLGTSTITTGSHSYVILINAGAGTINVNASDATIVENTTKSGKPIFYGGSRTYGTLRFSGTRPIVGINGSNTFATLEHSDPSFASTIEFQAGTTQYIDNLSLSGSSGHLRTLKSSSTGTRWYISKPSGTVNATYLSIQDSSAIGGAAWYARQSTNGGNNTGWLYFAGYQRNAIGSLIFSGYANRFLTATRSATGSIVFSARAYAIKRADPSTIEEKEFLYKSYDEDDNFIEVWDDVISEPNWSQELNTTGSSISLTLARNSDSIAVSYEPILDSSGSSIKDSNNFDILSSVESKTKVGPGSSVNHGNRVDIYVFYGETDTINDNFDLPIEDSNGESLTGTIGAPNGIRRFSGFISTINTKYGDTENTEVELMSYGYDLDQYPVVTSGGDTTVPFNSTDPGTMVRTALDQFATDAAGESYTTYLTSTVQTTGTTPSYTFRTNTYKEVLETAVKLAPSGWFFWVGLGDNLVRFLPKPSTAQHVFYLGKHIKTLNLRSYTGDSINDVIFGGGGDPALYIRRTAAPVIGTRRGLSRQSDLRVELEASADILAEGEISEKNVVQYRTTVDILDKTYDIESIQLGDMVGFRNFDNQVDSLLMQVVALNYTPDVITLQLDTLPPSLPKRLEELRKALDTQQYENVPAAPTL